MPRTRTFVNAFNGRELVALSGLKPSMVNYLATAGFLEAAYRPGSSSRGSTRYYSYRDLLVARVIGRLASAGVELKRLKEALIDLQRAELWRELDPARVLPLLVVSGEKVLLQERDGAIRELTSRGQLVFAFVLDLGETVNELKAGMDNDRRLNFSYEVLPLREGV